MIISRTPFRVSFFGGGTDYPSWYLKHGGAVLATTINKYCYISCRYLPPFFGHRFRIVYSKIENCRRVEEIGHPAVRAVLTYLGIKRGIEIHHDGDLPARSGMGSSSAFTVGLLAALYALKGHLPTADQLARESIHVEKELLQENVGTQDQVLASHGGLNHIVFAPSGDISVRPVTLPHDRMRELNSHLLLFFTGINRTASSIAQSYSRDLDSKEKQMRALLDMVGEGISILSNGREINDFGKLLDEGWQLKRSLSATVSTPLVEEIYEAARSAGAIGGKLLGAGGGGFMLLFVPRAYQKKVRERLKDLICVPFKFEFSGSRIIFFDPEEDYSREERIRATQQIRAFKELMPQSVESV
ncbi:MAG: kinase [bacterium]